MHEAPFEEEEHAELAGLGLRHSVVLQPSVGVWPECSLEVSVPALWDTCGFCGGRKGRECGK